MGAGISARALRARMRRGLARIHRKLVRAGVPARLGEHGWVVEGSGFRVGYGSVQRASNAEVFVPLHVKVDGETYSRIGEGERGLERIKQLYGTTSTNNPRRRIRYRGRLRGRRAGLRRAANPRTIGLPEVVRKIARGRYITLSELVLVEQSGNQRLVRRALRLLRPTQDEAYDWHLTHRVWWPTHGA